MDRNYKERPGQKARPNVALRKESVDRNVACAAFKIPFPVALRKESVDRNAHAVDLACKMGGRSP